MLKHDFNYYDFKKFANKRLHRLKENRITQYEKYVEAHFGRLIEDHHEDLVEIGTHYGLNSARLSVDEKAFYNGNEYAYFIHDDNQYIALNDDMVIVDTGDYDVNQLKSFEVVSEDAKSDYDRLKEEIYKKREAEALANMKIKTSNPAEYEKREKAATDAFIKGLRDLRKFAKDNNL